MTAEVRVFGDQDTWLGENFTPAELLAPSISGDGADPDGDGWDNRQEFQFRTDPRSASSRPDLRAGLVDIEGEPALEFDSHHPIDSEACAMFVESSADLVNWIPLLASFPAVVERDADRFRVRLSRGLVRG